MSILATLLTLAFIGWLLHTEVKRRGHLPTTMWIPFIWFLVKASRPVALWFRTGGVDEISGNPYDAVLDLVLIIGAYLIVRNKHPWKRIWESNPYFSLIVIFFLISVVWSPFPYVAMKRWVREVGNILMALVILTDAKPAETLKTLGVRCAYILLPLSELLVRFFPEFGRVYTNGGAPTITGVTTQKNELGIMCAILGLLLVWDILDTWRERKLTGKKISLVAQWIALGWILRFLHTSDSKTSILALALGCVILLSTYLKSIRNRPVLFGRACVLLVITGLLAVTFVTTKLSWVFNALGRDVTFTERDG